MWYQVPNSHWLSTSFKLQAPDFDNFTQTEFEVYHIEYTYISTVSVTFIQYPASSYTIGELLNGAEYSIRMAVNNSAGLGDYSSPPVIITTSAIGKYKNIHFYHTIRGNTLLHVDFHTYLCDNLNAW